MKHKIYTVLILACLILAGCSYSKISDNATSPASNSDSGNVINQKEAAFNKFNELVYSMDKIRTQVGSQYNDLINNQISTDEFRQKNQLLQESMSQVNLKADSTEFNLSEKDKQEANFDALNRSFLVASKDLTDYLYLANHLKDDKLKAKFQELIIEKYDKDVVNLKNLLAGTN